MRMYARTVGMAVMTAAARIFVWSFENSPMKNCGSSVTTWLERFCRNTRGSR